ncbi:MAG TPA: LicD family protein [Stenotrophomonas sp.]|nr:LicD family protein [Stenotrophomonas sp.]
MSAATPEVTPLLAGGVALRDVQQRALAVLEALAGFCDRHGLRYYLVGGTLLGALRHEGFIPWDDDIDIALPRADYQRLLALADSLPRGLRAIHPSRDADTPYPFLVVRDARSRLVIDYARPFDRGIGVDVFPIDAVPAPGPRRDVLFKAIALMRAWTMNKQQGYYPHRVAASRQLRFLLLSLASQLCPSTKIYRLYERLVARGDVACSPYVGNLYGLYGRREVVQAEVFGEGGWVRFEGIRFRAPVQAERYLESVYGDFRHLPPPAQRRSGHRIRAVALG